MAQMVQLEDLVQVLEVSFSVSGQLKSHDGVFEINAWRDDISDEVKMIRTNTTYESQEEKY